MTLAQNSVTLPLDIMAIIFSYLSSSDVCLVCTNVCKAWNYFATSAVYVWKHRFVSFENWPEFESVSNYFACRTSLSNGNSAGDWFGADDIALERALRALLRFQKGVSKLEELGLYINVWLTLEGAKRIMSVFSSDLAAQITSLTVNYLGYPEIESLVNLKRLTLDLRGAASLFIPQSTSGGLVTHIPELHRSHFPTSGKLEELRIWSTRETNEQIHLTRVLPGLRVFELRGSINTIFCDSGAHVKRLDAVMPNLEIFDWELWQSCFYLTHRDIALPRTLLKLRLRVVGLHALPSLNNLSRLTELDFLHHRLPPSWDLAPHVPGGFPLDSVLTVDSLQTLKIVQRSAEMGQYLPFFEKLSSPSTLPQLQEFTLVGSCLPEASLVGARPKVRFNLRPRTEKAPEKELEFWSTLNPNDPLLASPRESERKVCRHCHKRVNTYIEDHLAMCPCLKVKCPLGCSVVCMRAEISDHLAICPLYSIVCVICGCTLNRASYHAHTLLHNDLESNIQRPLLGRPSFQSPLFHKVLTKCCDQHFKDANEAMAHQCTVHTKYDFRLRFTDRQAARWKRLRFTPDHEAHTNGFFFIQPHSSLPK